MSFANDIIGGAAALVRAAIKSPNFVHGSTGWSLNKDGSFEAQDATIRGTITAGEFDGTNFIINNDGAFFYNGAPAAGNLVLSIAGQAGTDDFGNPYNAGAFTPSFDINGDASGFVAGRLSFLNSGGNGVQAGLSLAGNVVWSSTSGSRSIDVSALNLVAGAASFSAAVTASGGTAASPTVITTDTWTNVTPPTGFSGLLRYRMRAEKDVEVEAQLAVAATMGAGAVALIALPAAYVPAKLQRGPCGIFLNGVPASLAAVQGIMDLRWSANPSPTSTFSLQEFPGGASGTGVTECSFNIRYALD